jgi:integrase
MPHLAPPTLTAAEQKAILRATAANVRYHTSFSMALGTGFRLAELVGLNVGDVFAPDGKPRVRVRVRAEIAKGHRTADSDFGLLRPRSCLRASNRLFPGGRHRPHFR